MKKNDLILFAGIIAALIWLALCIFIEGKNRKYVIISGIVIDVVLFVICKNHEMLLIALLGGLACGLVPQLSSVRKYKIAVHEMNGVKNWLVVSIIFFVMIFMTMSIAFPEIIIDLG